MRTTLLGSLMIVVATACGGTAGNNTPLEPETDSQVTFTDSGAPAPDSGTPTGTCTLDETRACDTGLQGLCATGEQRCVAQGTATGWGLCSPIVVPGEKSEECGGSEDVDCDGKLPADDEDCTPAVDTCKNGIKDPGEIDVDCGGVCAAKCKDGSTCTANGDCQNNSCYQGRCAIPPCQNGVKDAGETDVDCGGTCSALCAQGQGCADNGDCSSGTCQDGRCVVCGPNAPTLSGSACDQVMTVGMDNLELDGNTLELTCLKGGWFDDSPTPYSAAITLAGATFSGSGCGFAEHFQSMDIDTMRNTLTVTCVKYWFDSETTVTHTISVANAKLSGGCGMLQKAIRISAVSPTRLQLLCEDKMYWGDGTPPQSTHYLDFLPVTICN